MKTYPSLHTRALILKRSNFGEKDRILTMYTEKKGKVSVVAKGCRSLQSSRLSMLEPGNCINAYLIQTKGMPLLTESRVIETFIQTKASLQSMKRLLQVLELVDRLAVEDENLDAFEHMLSLLYGLNNQTFSVPQIKSSLSQLVELLGFPSLEETQYETVTEYVSMLAERPLRSYEYLTVKAG